MALACPKWTPKFDANPFTKRRFLHKSIYGSHLSEKWSPLTSVNQSQRIWTQDTAIPTSLPCCARASFYLPCSKHSSTLKVNIGRALCFLFCIFVKKQIPILHAGSLSHKSNTSSFHFFHQKNKFLYYTLDPRASKSLLFLEILIKKQYLFDPRPSPILPEPQNRCFS